MLPEAFNIRKEYLCRTSPCDILPGDVSETQGIAQEFGVSFIAGLIVAENYGYSSAYFIGDSKPVLMCHKTCKDDMGTDDDAPDRLKHNYRTCDVDSCDKCNPHAIHDVDSETMIGAFLCVDANPPNSYVKPFRAQDRAYLSPQHYRRDMVSRATADIVCIPACAVYDFTGGTAGEPGRSIDLFGKNRIVVLANSHPFGLKSFITSRQGEVLDLSMTGPRNEVVLAELVRDDDGQYTAKVPPR